jgi:hypothetical protein
MERDRRGSVGGKAIINIRTKRHNGGACEAHHHFIFNEETPPTFSNLTNMIMDEYWHTLYLFHRCILMSLSNQVDLHLQVP